LILVSVVGITYFIWARVIVLRKAVLKSDVHGHQRWVDTWGGSGRTRNKYSGFVNKFGSLFNHHKSSSAALFFKPVKLVHALLVGVFIGAMDSRPDPDDHDHRHRQTSCLVVVSSAFLGFILFVA
jgi:hypothetical protein